MSQELWPDSEGPIMESGTELNKLKWTEVLVPKLKGFLSFYTQTWLGIVFNLSYSSKTKPKNKQTTPATFWFPLTDCPCAQNSWPFSQMPLLDTPYSSVYSLPPSYPHPLPIRFSLKFHMLRCFFFFFLLIQHWAYTCPTKRPLWKSRSCDTLCLRLWNHIPGYFCMSPRRVLPHKLWNSRKRNNNLFFKTIPSQRLSLPEKRLKKIESLKRAFPK